MFFEFVLGHISDVHYAKQKQSFETLAVEK